MNLGSEIFWKLGAFFGCSSVVLGAFGAHSIKDKLSSFPDGQKRLEYWMTGAQYQMCHSIALLLFSIKSNAQTIQWPGYFLVAGIIGFSGSLYLLTLDKDRRIGRYIWPVTPLGGLCFIIGWSGLAFV